MQVLQLSQEEALPNQVEQPPLLQLPMRDKVQWEVEQALVLPLVIQLA